MFPFLMCSSLHWYGWSIYYRDVCLPQPSLPAWGYKWGLFPINTWIPLVSSPYQLIWKSQSFPKPIYGGSSKAVRFLCSWVRPLNVCCLLCGSVWLSCAHSGAHNCPCTWPRRFLVLGTHQAVAVSGFYPKWERQTSLPPCWPQLRILEEVAWDPQH